MVSLNNVRKHSGWIVIVITALIALIIPFLLKQPVMKVLAQGDSPRNAKISNTALGQQEHEKQALSGSPATAFTASEADVVPFSDGSGVEVIPIGAFRNDGDNVDGWFNWFTRGYIRNDGVQDACFMAPTYPPNGSTLAGIGISLLDQSSSKNLYFAELKRVRLSTGTVDYMAGGDIIRNNSNATELFASVVPETAVVSNAYAYYFHLCFPGSSGTDILLYGARLFYIP